MCQVHAIKQCIFIKLTTSEIVYWRLDSKEVVKPELEGKEGGARALVELGLELDPVKSESVEEGGQALHQYWERNN